MFYHKSFSFLLSASLSVCFQLLITLCLVAEKKTKKKKKERKRSGPFEYSLMDLTGKGSLSRSARGRGVIQHSGREEVGAKCLFQPLKLGVFFPLTLSLVGRAGDEGQGRKKQT